MINVRIFRGSDQLPWNNMDLQTRIRSWWQWCTCLLGAQPQMANADWILKWASSSGRRKQVWHFLWERQFCKWRVLHLFNSLYFCRSFTRVPVKGEDEVEKGNRWRYPGSNLADKTYPVYLVEEQSFLRNGSLWLSSHYFALLAVKLCSNTWLSLHCLNYVSAVMCLKYWQAIPLEMFEGRVYSFVTILVTLSSLPRSCHKLSAGLYSVPSGRVTLHQWAIKFGQWAPYMTMVSWTSWMFFGHDPETYRIIWSLSKIREREGVSKFNRWKGESQSLIQFDTEKWTDVVFLWLRYVDWNLYSLHRNEFQLYIRE